MTVPSGQLEKSLGKIRAEMGSHDTTSVYDGSAYDPSSYVDISMGDMATQMADIGGNGSYFTDIFGNNPGVNTVGNNGITILNIGTPSGGDVLMSGWASYNHSLSAS